MKNLNYLVIIIIILLSACNSDRNPKKMDMNLIVSEIGNGSETELSDEAMNDIIQSIPSPLELAAVIRGTGVDFNEEILNPVENVNLNATSYDKALSMGIFSGDLGYINMYEKSYLALNYLGSIKKLADELKIGHFFDFATIKRLASNSDKIDSLLYISTTNFSKMDNYLRSQKRSNLSALIVAGSWIEGLYIASEIASSNPSDELIERIGEQKIALDQIMLVLEIYKTDPYFQELSENFASIQGIFDEVTITYNYQEPETKEVDGRLVIVNNSTTTVNITLEQVHYIREAVGQVREQIIGSI